MSLAHPGSPTSRVALYGHDSVGLGHLRRNLTLARAVSALPEQPDVLVLSGTAEAMSFELPPRTDIVVMPAVCKDGRGSYGSRRLSCGLDELVALRRATATAALTTFAPDLLIVDKRPLGFAGELEPALQQLRRDLGTRIVLGLRDVLDEPSLAQREWRRERMSEAVRSYVDEIWVYGDPRVHDVAAACGVPPALRRTIRYTGYLAAGRIAGAGRPPGIPTEGGYVLCTVGGGQDGFALGRAFLDVDLPDGLVGVLVTGPQMSTAEATTLRALAAARDDMVVAAFSPEVDHWLPSAAATVSMGGYNTVAEILSTDVPALVVPRPRPRAEQVVRAEALGRLGLLDVLGADALSPAAIARWLESAIGGPRPARTGIDLDGMSSVGDLAARLLRHGSLHAVAV